MPGIKKKKLCQIWWKFNKKFKCQNHKHRSKQFKFSSPLLPVKAKHYLLVKCAVWVARFLMDKSNWRNKKHYLLPLTWTAWAITLTSIDYCDTAKFTTLQLQPKRGKHFNWNVVSRQLWNVVNVTAMQKYIYMVTILTSWTQKIIQLAKSARKIKRRQKKKKPWTNNQACTPTSGTTAYLFQGTKQINRHNQEHGNWKAGRGAELI